MALPDNGIAWPPEGLTNILQKLRTFSAWYANETQTLADIYSKSNSRRTGVLEKIRTWFLGARNNGQRDESTIHLNLAQEICRTSANLLHSEPPVATVEDESVQDRLEVIAGPGFHQTMVSAAETSAALGGTYFRSTWDKAVKDHAFVTKVDADLAWPVFSWGELIEVTFWSTIETKDTVVFRLLENHWTDNAGIGMTSYGLYKGTLDNLGQNLPFEDHKATEWLTRTDVVTQLIDGVTLSTGTPGLAVSYAPNISPSALWRTDPIGANLGRSDLEGIEQPLDALDELYSAWLRDIRLGKGRLIVGESMLRDLGAGMGSGFDLDTTIFTPVKAAPSSAGSEKMAIEQVQFEIRTEDFMVAIDHFRRIILTAAGYSPATFGMSDSGGNAITATEVAAKAQTSYTTRKRKILGLKPALEYILQKTLAVDALVFPGEGAKDVPVTVEFPDGVAEDEKTIAERNQLDYTSQSASIDTRVRNAHPDWDDTKVGEEVERIREDFNLGALTDPTTFGQDGQGLTEPPGNIPQTATE